jgi:hypothetical protein
MGGDADARLKREPEPMNVCAFCEAEAGELAMLNAVDHEVVGALAAAIRSGDTAEAEQPARPPFRGRQAGLEWAIANGRIAGRPRAA